jgi:hypothetical protein
MTTTTVAARSQARGISNFASGSFTSDGNVTNITLGFVPRYMKVFNNTDVIQWEKTEGMAAADAVKTAAGSTGASDTIATTVETGSDVLFNSDGTVSLSAALVGSSKAISWIAMA